MYIYIYLSVYIYIYRYILYTEQSGVLPKWLLQFVGAALARMFQVFMLGLKMWLNDLQLSMDGGPAWNLLIQPLIPRDISQLKWISPTKHNRFVKKEKRIKTRFENTSGFQGIECFSHERMVWKQSCNSTVREGQAGVYSWHSIKFGGLCWLLYLPEDKPMPMQDNSSASWVGGSALTRWWPTLHASLWHMLATSRLVVRVG